MTNKQKWKIEQIFQSFDEYEKARSGDSDVEEARERILRRRRDVSLHETTDEDQLNTSNDDG